MAQIVKLFQFQLSENYQNHNDLSQSSIHPPFLRMGPGDVPQEPTGAEDEGDLGYGRPEARSSSICNGQE